MRLKKLRSLMLDACMLIKVYWILYNSTMVQQNKSRWHMQFSWMDHRAKAFEGSHISLPSTTVATILPRRRPPRRHLPPSGRLFNEWGSKTWALLCLTRARDISPILSTLWQITIEVNDQVACEHHQQASWCISAAQLGPLQLWPKFQNLFKNHEV